MQNPKSSRLDLLSIEKILHLMDEEDRSVPQAVKKVNPEIAQAVRIMVASLKKEGRIFFVGAGTSGRLGVMEAAECPPTFNTHPRLIQALMAGGRKAVFRSQEGAEDREGEAERAVRKKVRMGDIVVGISASGVTPFVRGALEESKKRKAKTILIACNLSTPLGSEVDILIAPQLGPELITGSTRLKAGTATKLILNRLTVVSMTQLGKIYGNRMVDLQPKSRKLKARALRILRSLAGVSDQKARDLFQRAKGRVKVAVLMAKKNLSYRKALTRLRKNDGFLRKAME